MVLNNFFQIPVDNTLSEVTVSVSGAKPEIRVVDPQGQQITGPPKLITTLDLSEIMVGSPTHLAFNDVILSILCKS